MPSDTPPARGRWSVGRLFSASSGSRSHSSDDEKHAPRRPPASTWSMGILNDSETIEVPGSVLLLAADRNEPLGLRNVHARNSHSSIPTGFAVDMPTTPGGSRPRHSSSAAEPPVIPPEPQTENQEDEEKKRTEDGTIILEPQPDDSANDPLNWPGWRRDTALLSLGFYCMIGGGMTPIIAAGFTDVAKEYDVGVEKVALTTGLYMMGLGLGSVVVSPTAILYGKRPVYLVSAIILIGTSLWAAWAPTFESLLAARVFQGVAISPVECLPSATVAEIFFLHERAFRIGIYTLLLLGGKNIVPLVSAAIIGRFGWRWTFWIVSMVVAFGAVLLFLFVPETFWDRTPTRKAHKKAGFLRRLSSRHGFHLHRPLPPPTAGGDAEVPQSPGAIERHRDLHVGFTSAADTDLAQGNSTVPRRSHEDPSTVTMPKATHDPHSSRHVGFTQEGSDGGTSQEVSQTHEGSHASSAVAPTTLDEGKPSCTDMPCPLDNTDGVHSPKSEVPGAPELQNPNMHRERSNTGSDAGSGYFRRPSNWDSESMRSHSSRMASNIKAYTTYLRQQPPQSFIQQLRPWNGRLNKDKWLKVMMRPFILYAYPAVLWSSLVYACSIGWLIVISETMAVIYRDPEEYSFTALQTGLVYLSPFIGGILGTGVAGKVSDVIVRAMARRNGGMYEPEFRIVMAFPVLITTCLGLMGFGWSAQKQDHWMVPTAFFGIVSFGCSLGSTTSITFCVDSYRQYAGEALVTLNFTKNIVHGLVFSLFVSRWLEDDGPKMVYMWLGIIQLIVLLTSVPMYIYGKRARMWTVRKNLMEKF